MSYGIFFLNIANESEQSYKLFPLIIWFKEIANIFCIFPSLCRKTALNNFSSIVCHARKMHDTIKYLLKFYASRRKSAQLERSDSSSQ